LVVDRRVVDEGLRWGEGGSRVVTGQREGASERRETTTRRIMYSTDGSLCTGRQSESIR
jgi:hypothetical protein